MEENENEFENESENKNLNGKGSFQWRELQARPPSEIQPNQTKPNWIKPSTTTCWRSVPCVVLCWLCSSWSFLYEHTRIVAKLQTVQLDPTNSIRVSLFRSSSPLYWSWNSAVNFNWLDKFCQVRLLSIFSFELSTFNSPLPHSQLVSQQAAALYMSVWTVSRLSILTSHLSTVDCRRFASSIGESRVDNRKSGSSTILQFKLLTFPIWHAQSSSFDIRAHCVRRISKLSWPSCRRREAQSMS